MTPQRFRLHNVGSMLGTFGVANLQADPNCVLAQLPDYGVWGLQDFPPGTYTETQRYQWAAQKQVPWLRRNIVNSSQALGAAPWTTQLSTRTTGVTDPIGGTTAVNIAHTSQYGNLQGSIIQLVTGVTYTVSYWMRRDSGTNTLSTILGPTGTYLASHVGVDSTWRRYSMTFTASATATAEVHVGQDRNSANRTSVDIAFIQIEVGSTATDYQPIGASWDATYAALAAAAGFPVGIWQDAGTNPVNTSGQSVYRITDASGKGYTADQATAANRPLWTLDANAKPYLLGDNVNDAMPVTFPASFSSNASVYVTTDAGTTVTDAVTLNGSYAPLVAAKQYARVIFKSGRPAYHEKLIRWLNAKAGL